eukprot:TRINITY_DN35643_c0_g1_i1.p1 TRINITY_DN35643_c0_g1~~TRINITY_DN35643_c0_g1_i1.p1  ORF type:complete len:434 (+),score=55.77 TRINITY_DN35643_c0_g1_i1:62-1363(+)
MVLHAHRLDRLLATVLLFLLAMPRSDPAPGLRACFSAPVQRSALFTPTASLLAGAASDHRSNLTSLLLQRNLPFAGAAAALAGALVASIRCRRKSMHARRALPVSVPGGMQHNSQSVGGAFEETFQQDESSESFEVAADGSVITDAQPVPPQVKAWRAFWKFGSLDQLWTAADIAHIHALSGGAYLVGGFAFLMDTMLHDIAIHYEGRWSTVLSTDFALACLALGTANALSGLQPRLLSGRPAKLLRALGLGEDADLKSGGFVNAALFYLVLVYQSVRALPSFPQALGAMDSGVGFLALLLILHQAWIIFSWIRKGAMEGTDAMFLPGMFNLPVALHLFLHGPDWVNQMSDTYVGFPEFFFFANFAIAWCCSAVTFLLSIHERRVISQGLRNFLMLLIPIVFVFATVPPRAWLLMPQWFHGELAVMFTLSPRL